MSLDAEQRRRTSGELTDNHRRTGRPLADLERELSLTADQQVATFELRPTADPATVWRLRDSLEGAVRAAGGEPRPYSCLTEAARAWFDLR